MNVPGAASSDWRAGGVAPALTSSDRQAGAARGGGDRRHQHRARPGHLPQLVVRVRVIGVPGVAEDALQPQAGQRVHRPQERRPRSAGSGSMPQRWKPTSIFTSTSTRWPAAAIASDQRRATARSSTMNESRARCCSASTRRRRPAAADRAAARRATPASTNTSASPSLAQQMPTAPASICERGDDRALVGLGVRAQRHAGGGGGRLHAGDVGEQPRPLDQDGRRLAGRRGSPAHDTRAR